MFCRTFETLNIKQMNLAKIRLVLMISAAYISMCQPLYSQELRAYKAPVFEKTWHLPSQHPDRIVLNLTADPATSMSVTWRTSTEVLTGYAEIAKASAAPKFWRNAIRYTAQTETMDAREVQRAGLMVHHHSVTFTSLSPNTLYAYRVGDGDHWSEWIQFKTADNRPERFSFLYVGDAQNYIMELWSRLIRQGYRQAPEASFIIHAGDLINNAHADTEWHEWFMAGAWIHSMLPSIPVTGNHEYGPYTAGGTRNLSIQWRPQFTLPNNGPEGLEETVYYIDYQGARIITLNTNEDKQKQALWLEEVLKNNPKQWTILTYHHPLYSASDGRDNVEWREILKPLFDKYGVDLALQGHDHAYARGRVAPPEYNLLSGVNKWDQTGTVYVVSVSGGKMYNARTNGWNDFEGADRERFAENTQLFQVITVDGNQLHYTSYTAVGELYDAFQLIKNGEGPNTFVELQHKAISTRTNANTISYYDQLPPEVQTELMGRYPGFVVKRVAIIERGGQTLYDVQIIKDDMVLNFDVDTKGNIKRRE